MTIYISFSEPRNFINYLTTFCKDFGSTVLADSIAAYKKRMETIDTCDVMVVDLTDYSLTLGMEIEHAIGAKKHVICLFDLLKGKELPKGILDNDKIKLIGYANLGTAEKKLTKILQEYLTQWNEEQDTIIGHPRCHYGDCYDCHVVSCAIQQGFVPIPDKSERQK